VTSEPLRVRISQVYPRVPRRGGEVRGVDAVVTPKRRKSRSNRRRLPLRLRLNLPRPKSNQVRLWLLLQRKKRSHRTKGKAKPRAKSKGSQGAKTNLRHLLDPPQKLAPRLDPQSMMLG